MSVVSLFVKGVRCSVRRPRQTPESATYAPDLFVRRCPRYSGANLLACSATFQGKNDAKCVPTRFVQARPKGMISTRGSSGHVRGSQYRELNQVRSWNPCKDGAKEGPTKPPSIPRMRGSGKHAVVHFPNCHVPFVHLLCLVFFPQEPKSFFAPAESLPHLREWFGQSQHTSRSGLPCEVPVVEPDCAFNPTQQVTATVANNSTRHWLVRCRTATESCGPRLCR